MKSSSALFSHKIHQDAAGYTHSLSGGVIISLDLSRAFDEVPREKLYKALLELGIDDVLDNILKHIYSDTRMEFAFKNVYRSFKAEKGIRQGCSAAPTLWVLYTLSLLQQLSRDTTLEWIQKALAIYADDICAHFLYWGMEEFESNLYNVGRLFDILESFGVSVNFSKTAALIHCKAKFNSKYILRTKNGHYLRIPRRDGSCTELQLKSAHMYLGVMLTYKNSKQRTMARRIQAGRKSESVMRKWIFTHKGFSRCQRVRLWNQCIYPCITAGILAAGVDQNTLQQFDSFCLHSLRKIFRQPVHLELLSHADFITRFRLKDPLVMLRKLCQKMIHRHQQRVQ